jgi:methylenetetrahydrofolate dehydrogenase (NADP+)/methenyltetrahydrofolate cyclohydrolase
MADCILIDGKARAAALRDSVAAEVARLKRDHGLQPGLAVVLVGEDPASQVYVRSKGEQSLAAGMRSETHRLAADTAQDALHALIDRLNRDPGIHGVLIQLPLPAHLDAALALARLDPDKDVDGLTVVSAGRLRDALGDLAGRNAVVLGRSVLVGRPVAALLLADNCTVTIAHSRSRDLPAICRGADILVVAVGRPEMVRGDWIRPGAAVIDVGINRVPFRDPAQAALGRTRLVGDVAFQEARRTAGWLTPVPGGVGPMTVACLLQNTLTAARRQAGLDEAAP